MLYYSFDIGGTSIKHAMVSHDGVIVEKFKEINSCQLMTDTLLKKVLLEEIASKKKSYNIKGICISSTGVVDPFTKQVIFSGPTLPHYGKSSVFTEIEKSVNLPLTIENDVNCAILGEYWKGNLKNVKNGFMITIGTGVGGAIMMDGSLYRGMNYSAGEIGYLNYEETHFQNKASTKNLVETISRRKKQKLNGYEVISLVKENDPLAQEAMATFIESLTFGIMDVMYLLNPDKIILGGGIMEEHEFLIPMIENEIDTMIIDDFFSQTLIEPAYLGNNAGIVGSVFHHLQTLEES